MFTLTVEQLIVEVVAEGGGNLDQLAADAAEGGCCIDLWTKPQPTEPSAVLTPQWVREHGALRIQRVVLESRVPSPRCNVPPDPVNPPTSRQPNHILTIGTFVNKCEYQCFFLNKLLTYVH